MKRKLKTIIKEQDSRWTLIWLLGVLSLWIWDIFFLNAPARDKLEIGFLTSLWMAGLVILSSLTAAWGVVNLLYLTEQKQLRPALMTLNIGLNTLRSIPQIIGILMGYVLITAAIQSGWLSSSFAISFWMSLVISIFVFLEIVDLLQERISYFKKLDFFNAMLVCGIPELRIVNREILWKNSLAQVFNKIISVFGMAIFLQCSIDFILSVGLSTQVSAANLPVTLGSLLAKIDSKQDILAIGSSLTNPAYIPNLFFQHLQGISVAFLIVFTLICIFKIADGFAERHEL